MPQPTMSAVCVSDYGEPNVLKVEQIPRPEPKQGMVLVRVKSTAVNPIDWKLRSGAYKAFMPLQFPWIPGIEGAGIVETLGLGVTKLVLGQPVYGPMQGAYAEFALAKLEDLQIKPAAISFDEAAGVGVGALTAWGALFEAADVKQGQRVVVHGAAGGVGLYAVQLARWKGATVIGTTSAANVEFVRSIGASALDYKTVRFEDAVHDVDVVIDTVGGDLVQRSLAIVRKGGVIVTTAGMPAADLGQAQGVRVMSVTRSSSEKLRDVNRLIEDRTIRPCAGRAFAMREVSLAHELSQTGHGRGRIILHVAD